MAKTEDIVLLALTPRAALAPAFWLKAIHSELSLASNIYNVFDPAAPATTSIALSGNAAIPQRLFVPRVQAAPVTGAALAALPVSLYQDELTARSSEVHLPQIGRASCRERV